jgi:hypothetical protein
MGGIELRIYSNRGIITATLAFFLLSVGDAVLTLWGLSINAIEEANPVMKLLIERYPQIFLLLKIMVPVILGIYCWWNRNTDRKLVTYALGLAIGVYVVVSLFHVYWIIMYNIS